MAPNDPPVAVCSGFLALSLELRQQVYEDYFTNCSCPDAKQIHEDILPSEYTNFTLPLLLINKQVSQEVLDCLIRQKQHTYRITWQSADFDGLALSCIRARKIRRAVYASIPHLRIEIYPPHADRPIDMVTILGSVIALCEELRSIERLQHICVVFIENEIAKWSSARKPRMSMGWSMGWSMGPWQESNYAPNIESILRLFGTLRNVTNATIQLPESFPDNLFLTCESTVQETAATSEQAMMSSALLDNEMDREFVSRLRIDLDCEEPFLQRDTGKKSLARFQAQGYGGWCTGHVDRLCHFLKVWPYMYSFRKDGDMSRPMIEPATTPDAELRDERDEVPFLSLQETAPQ